MDNNIDAIDLLKELTPDSINQTLSEKYFSPTFLEIIGKSKSETVHTNFLKWLFNQKEWNKECIARFICALNEKSKEQGLKSLVLENEDFTISNINASTCYKCVLKVNNKINNSYVDLLITCKLNEIPVKIIIENKIDSSEHDNQTWKYYAYFSKDDSYTNTEGIEVYKRKHNYNGETNELKFFVYLAPEWNNDSDSKLGICEHFIRFTYQDLYNNVLSFVDNIPKSEHNSFIFKEYLDTLFHPQIDRKGNIKVLVETKKYREILKLLEQIIKNTVPKNQKIPNKHSIETEITKIKRKVPQWKRRETQINSRILSLFMTLSENGEKGVFRDLLKDEFDNLYPEDKHLFMRNYNQMKNFGTKNHGKVFEEDDELSVFLWSPIKDFIKEMFSH